MPEWQSQRLLWVFIATCHKVLGIELDVYLIQHAESKLKEQDPARPLTDRGKKTAEDVRTHLAKLEISFDRVFHSGKLRAQQTAEILGSLAINNQVESHSGLEPTDPVEPIMRWIADLAEQGFKSVAIVGHLPFLDKLSSKLITGSESAEVIAFQNAGVVRLVPKTEGQGYSVRSALLPELL